MRFPLGGVPHELLRLEIAKDGEHRGVGEIGRQLVADFGDRARSEVPEHAHDVQLAVAQHEVVHCSLSTKV